MQVLVWDENDSCWKSATLYIMDFSRMELEPPEPKQPKPTVQTKVPEIPLGPHQHLIGVIRGKAGAKPEGS